MGTLGRLGWKPWIKRDGDPGHRGMGILDTEGWGSWTQRDGDPG